MAVHLEGDGQVCQPHPRQGPCGLRAEDVILSTYFRPVGRDSFTARLFMHLLLK